LPFHSGREADHSPPSSVEVKKWMELYLHSPNAPSWRGAQLGGAQGQLFMILSLVSDLRFPFQVSVTQLHTHPPNVACSS
jgi:hypothetical protein